MKLCKFTFNKVFSLYSCILCLGVASIVSHLVLFSEETQAQFNTTITPDNSMGTNVSQNGTTYEISGGNVQGSNQFHSFTDFSVGTDDTAQFNGPGNINTIFSRVTGVNPSIIDGTIETTIPNADFVFVNENGVMFKENAVLDIGTSAGGPGSAYFSTAHVLVGQNGAWEFHSDINPTADALLTTAPLSEFRFIGEGISGITIEGSFLETAIDTSDPNNPVGKDLAFIGGDVEVNQEGSLFAPRGKIKIASVSDTAQVLISQADPYIEIQQATENTGVVTLDDFAFVDVSDSNGDEDGLSGSVLIRGGRFVMDNEALVLVDNSSVDSAPTGISVRVDGDVDLSNFSTLTTEAFEEGDSGKIEVYAKNVNVNSGAIIKTFTDAGDPGGNAGDIYIHAKESVTVQGVDAFDEPSQISSVAAGGSGHSGSVMITSHPDTPTMFPNVTLDDRGILETRSSTVGTARGITLHVRDLSVLGGSVLQVSNSGSGSTELLSIEAQGDVIVSGQFDNFTPSRIRNLATGTAGNYTNGGMSIESENFLLSGGARVLINSDLGDGGKMEITARNSLTISGDQTKLSTESDQQQLEPVTLNAPTITVADQGEVQAVTIGNAPAAGVNFIGGTMNFLNEALVETITEGSGNGGPISMIATHSIFVSGGSIIQSGSLINGSGQGGGISLNAGNSVSIAGSNSGLFSETQGPGMGGTISVEAGQVQLNNGATVSAQSTSAAPGAGNGGNVTINATGNLLTSNATVTTAAQKGQSGNISITGGQTTLLTNNTSVSSQSFGEGDAGDIFLGAGAFLGIANSSVTAQAGEANGGNIKLDSGFLILLLNSVISSSVQGGIGGNINIDPAWILGQNVQVRANAFDGQGGNISLIADNGVFFDASSVLDASSQLGINGSVDVQAPIINLSGIVIPLPQGTLKVAKMYAERCAAQKGGEFSSFVQGGRDGLPPSPGGFMPSPLHMSAPQSFPGSLPPVPESSGNMMKRLGLGSNSEFAKGSHWMIGDSVQGCAA